MLDFLERLLAGRWIAGPELKDAIEKAKRLNGIGERAIINFLGEEFSDKKDVEEAVGEYLRLISEIRKSGVSADISLKPTQLGLRISYDYALANYKRIVKKARASGIFTWLDMEASDTVSATIRMYYSELQQGDVGICLQAYLKRTAKDLARLVAKQGIIRLVKGAYKESPKVAFQSREEIEKSYDELMGYLFKHAREFTIATHDDRLVSRANSLNRSYQRMVTYAFLNGIRPSLAKALVMHGEKVSIYLPYGKRWIDYAYRRLREQGHAMLILRSLFSG